MAVLLSPWRLWAVEDNQECTWQIVLNKFETVGKNHGSDRFFEQEPLDTVDNLFGLLVDAPIDPEEVRGLGQVNGRGPGGASDWALDICPTSPCRNT